MFSNYSVKKPYTVIVAVIIIAILGTVSFLNISTDLLPSINLPYAIVATPYIGASPEEVEMTVTRSIEQRMASVSNIKNIQSISRENMSLIILEFGETTNMDAVFIEMRETLDSIKPFFPEGVGNSTMLKLNPDMMPIMVVSAGVTGMEISESSEFLKSRIVPELESVEGVASVDASGLVENQIHIILSDDKIEAINASIEEMMRASMAHLPPEAVLEMDFPNVSISKEMVSGIIKGQHFEMPTGYITEDNVDYLIRTGQRLADVEALEQLPIMLLPIEGLDTVLLADVADIIFLDNSGSRYSKVNGNDAITLTIQKQTDYSTSDLSNRLHEKMNALKSENPDLEFYTLMDQGEYIDVVINSLLMNLLLGGLLAILVLFVFLRDLKPTLIVGFSIPISLVTAVVLMYFADITLNIISMGGLALGVGMLVDNSIVVIENIYRMRNEGKSAIDASVEGAKQVSGAIMASTLTTVAVFLPIVFVQGFTREIFTDMGLTIAFSLLASLVIALTLVPMMSSKILVNNIKKNHRIFDGIITWYTKLLTFTLKHKVTVLALSVILLVSSVYGAFQIGTELFPTSDSGQLSVDLTLPKGTLFEDSILVADEVMEELLKNEAIESVGASIGAGGFGMGMNFSGSSDNEITFYVTLSQDRNATTDQVSQQIRETIDYDISISGNDMNFGAMSAGAVAVRIKGRTFETLEHLANEVAEVIRNVEGTVDVSTGIEETEPEFKLMVDHEKSISHGLTSAQVFMEVNKLLTADPSVTTLTMGITDYQIFVKDASASDNITREDILSHVIISPTGAEVAIEEIAHFVDSSGFKAINRINQQRYVTVTAGLADGYNIGLVSGEINEQLSKINLPDGYDIEAAGDGQMITDSFRDLFLMLALGVAFIYLIMVAQFQSLLSPFIVMFSIPLAFTGGFLALILTGKPVSIIAFVGLIVLSGVVVNNGIVFVDYVNKMRLEGLSKYDALLKTGRDRLRPIMMTALTTIFALSTISLGNAQGTEMMQPMAITAIGGLIYATFLTLLVVPSLYDLFHKDAK